MAIALDTTTQGTTTSTSPLTWNHTCTGSNLVLIVGVAVSAVSADPNCSGVTYNGTSLTLLGSKRAVFIYGQVSLWYLLNPSTGSNQVSVAFSGTTDKSCHAGATSWTGVAQTGQPDAVAGSTATTQNPSVTVTTVADNCWCIGIVGQNAITISSSLTERWHKD